MIKIMYRKISISKLASMPVLQCSEGRWDILTLLIHNICVFDVKHIVISFFEIMCWLFDCKTLSDGNIDIL